MSPPRTKNGSPASTKRTAQSRTRVSTTGSAQNEEIFNRNSSSHASISGREHGRAAARTRRTTTRRRDGKRRRQHALLLASVLAMLLSAIVIGLLACKVLSAQMANRTKASGSRSIHGNDAWSNTDDSDVSGLDLPQKRQHRGTGSGREFQDNREGIGALGNVEASPKQVRASSDESLGRWRLSMDKVGTVLGVAAVAICGIWLHQHMKTVAAPLDLEINDYADYAIDDYSDSDNINDETNVIDQEIIASVHFEHGDHNIHYAHEVPQPVKSTTREPATTMTKEPATTTPESLATTTPDSLATLIGWAPAGGYEEEYARHWVPVDWASAPRVVVGNRTWHLKEFSDGAKAGEAGIAVGTYWPHGLEKANRNYSTVMPDRYLLRWFGMEIQDVRLRRRKGATFANLRLLQGANGTTWHRGCLFESGIGHVDAPRLDVSGSPTLVRDLVECTTNYGIPWDSPAPTLLFLTHLENCTKKWGWTARIMENFKPTWSNMRSCDMIVEPNHKEGTPYQYSTICNDFRVPLVEFEVYNLDVDKHCPSHK